MTTHLYWCHPSGSLCGHEVAPDEALILGTLGERRADTFSGGAKGTHQINGADSNGHVLYEARHGGTQGNSIRVAHDPGPTGVGQENNLLRLAPTGRDFTVLFATDGGGASVTPSATDVANLVNTDPLAQLHLKATAQGTGVSGAGIAALMNLTGGLDNGDFRKFRTKPPSVVRLNTVEVV